MPELKPLTSIRGLAAIWVVFFHYNRTFELSQMGYLGVDLFFILSGFIISYVYMDKFSSSELVSKNIKRFLALRLARIYPLHIFHITTYGGLYTL